jgi:hypothetical protein
MTTLVSLSDTGHEINRKVESYLYGRRVTFTHQAIKNPFVIIYDGITIIGIVTGSMTFRSNARTTEVWPELADGMLLSDDELVQLHAKLIGFMRSL